MKILLVIVFILIGVLFVWQSYDTYKNSKMIKEKPILTNKQKKEIDYDLKCASFLWLILAAKEIYNIIVYLV